MKAFNWKSESKKADAAIKKGHTHKFTDPKKAIQWLKREGRKRGRQIASQLASKKIKEKETLDDFKKFKKNRRKSNTAIKKQNKKPKPTEMDMIISSPKLLRDIETAIKEVRQGKLLTRDRKEAFKK